MMDDTAVKLCACNNEWILLVNFCSSLPEQLITAGPILDEFFAALPPLLLAHLKVYPILANMGQSVVCSVVISRKLSKIDQ